MKIIITALLSLFFAVGANAQEKVNGISGFIKDSINQAPLPNAIISLKKINTNDVLHLLSDTAGFFIFKNIEPGKYQIIVTYVGYSSFIKSTVIITTAQSIKLGDIYLKLENIELKSVVVTATGKTPFIVFSAGKITLNVAQSPIANGGTAYDILLKAPGVMEQNNSLSFRAKSINMLIDGKAIHLSDEELKEMLSSIAASNIDKIEIIPNPSAKYDAVGSSVINIKTTRNKNYGINGNITTGVGIGHFFQYNEGLNLNYKSNKVAIYGSYNIQRANRFYDNKSNRAIDSSTNIIEHQYEKRVENSQSVRLGIDYDLNKRNILGIGFSEYLNSKGKNINDNSIWQNTLERNTVSIVQTKGNSKIANPSINLYYKCVIDSLGKELTMNIDYFTYKKKWQDDYNTKYYDANNQQLLPDYLLRDSSPANITTKSFSADYVFPSKIGKFEAGLKVQHTNSDNNILWQQQIASKWITDTSKTNHFIYQEKVSAAYLTFDKTIKRINIAAGIRAEQTNANGLLINSNSSNTKKYLNIFPNISIEYAKNINNVFDLSYRKSIQRFGFNLVNPFIVYQSQYSYYQGNPGIVPELSHNIEGSYTYKQALIFGTSYTHSLNVLVPIYLQGVNKQIVSTFSNLKSSDLFYAFTDFTYPIATWWVCDMNAGAGFLKYNTSTASSVGQSKNVSWSYLLQTENTFTFKNNWAAELNGYFRGPYASGIYMMDKYFTSSMGISKGIFHNKSVIKLALKDIFNTDEQSLKVNYEGIIMHVKNKVETRFLNIAFNYKFGKKNIKIKKEHASSIEDIKQRATTNK